MTTVTSDSSDSNHVICQMYMRADFEYRSVLGNSRRKIRKLARCFHVWSGMLMQSVINVAEKSVVLSEAPCNCISQWVPLHCIKRIFCGCNSNFYLPYNFWNPGSSSEINLNTVLRQCHQVGYGLKIVIPHCDFAVSKDRSEDFDLMSKASTWRVVNLIAISAN